MVIEMDEIYIGKKNKSGARTFKQGKRADLDNRYFRSAWEANYCRFLNLLIKQNIIFKWEYESQEFWFKGIKRGTRSYLPDFKIWEEDSESYYFVEIKGYMDPVSRVKLRRMTKYFPEVRIDLIQKKQYTEIQNKVGKLLPHWEW